MGYPYRQAKKVSYGGTRSLASVKYIVIHYTGNKGDTAKNNVDYFATGNTRQAGAHFFVDQKGTVWQSIDMKHTAWSVGGFFTTANGAGSYYKKCTNGNSVSIEMCDCASKDPSAAMTEAVKTLVRYIQNACPNAKTIIRHWDVNGKSCPARMTGKSNAKWTAFKKAITATSGKSDFSIPGLKAPTSIAKGHYFTIGGTLKSNLTMHRVEVGIVDSTGRKYVYHYDRKALSVTAFNIVAADQAMKFRYLAKGTYYFRIWAWDANGAHKVLDKKFTVK